MTKLLFFKFTFKNTPLSQLSLSNNMTDQLLHGPIALLNSRLIVLLSPLYVSLFKPLALEYCQQ